MNPEPEVVNIPAMVFHRVTAHCAETILRKKDRGIWKAVSWAELGVRAREVGMALKAIGLRPGNVAGVLAETRPESVYVDIGILGSGGICLAIHPHEKPDVVGHVLRESACRVLFVEDEEQLDKALTVRDHCPALQHIIIFNMKGLRDFADPACESFRSFMTRGATCHSAHPEDWNTSIAAIVADQPCVLHFALGVIGEKGRTLTHGDALRLITSASSVLGMRAGDERLALLPMCDVLERVLGLYLSLSVRAVSNYLESPDTVMENLQEVQPTVLGTDALIWQRLHARIEDAAAVATYVQRVLYNWAIAASERGGLKAVLARALVLRAVRLELGLSRLRHAYIGSTPLAPEIWRWTRALGISVRQFDG
jgi:long-chain acyl-CoA synthetase